MNASNIQIAYTTAIMGRMDVRKLLPTQTVKVYQYHFSDEHARSFDGMNSRTRALYFKTQTHHLLQEKFIIYVDGKVVVTSDKFVEHLMNTLGIEGFAMLKHGTRNCIYEEVDFIEKQIALGSDYLKVRYAHRPIREQVEYYRSMGYPSNRGLNDCSIFIRRNVPKINDLFDEWWDEIKDGRLFDQTAIQYLSWKKQIPIIPIEFPTQMFKLVKHLKVQ